MSDEIRPRPDISLTEAEARQVLERAAWSEAHRNTLTVAELTRVAEEAGYSREYVERAIDEILEERGLATRGAAPARTASAAEAEAKPRSGRFRRWIQTLKAGLTGAVVGAFARRAAGFSTITATDGMLFMFGLIFAVIAVLAFHHRRTGRQLEFQMLTGGLWLGFMAGWALTHGALEPELVRGVLSFWFLTGATGGAVVHFGGERDTASETPERA